MYTSPSELHTSIWTQKGHGRITEHVSTEPEYVIKAVDGRFGHGQFGLGRFGLGQFGLGRFGLGQFGLGRFGLAFFQSRTIRTYHFFGVNNN